MEYSFDIQHAQEYGVDEAIVIRNFVYWISRNKANNRNIHDGRTWTFNSVESFSVLFPFWTPGKIRRIIESLVKKGVLVKANYNKVAYDRTLWYAFKEEEKFISICQIRQMEMSENSNRIVADDEPIPDINTDVNTNKRKKSSRVGKKLYSESVWLTEQEAESLILKHGREVFDQIIDKLNNFKCSSGREYKSDYHAIKNWVEKEVVPVLTKKSVKQLRRILI